MTLRHQQYADLSDDAYVNREIGVTPAGKRRTVEIHGIDYEILEHYRNSANGYAGTVYQRVDTGDIVVAHRGTEVKNIPGVVMDLAYTDGSMVLGRVNPQAQDAIRLTQHALQFAEEKGLRNGGHTPEVTVTGHSLGGCLAQITAHHFDLRGETFNAYGAASLGLRIPEGGDRVLNHVMSADLVNAASPHYGQVRVYASQKEIDTLDRLGYDNTASRFDIRMKGMQPIATIGSHFMSNFTDDNPSGRSILADPDALARAHRHEAMIDKAREDMREQRGAFSGLADVARGLAGAAPERHAPLAAGEPALRAGEVRERVETPPLPAYLREGSQAPGPAAPSHPAPARDQTRPDAPERMAYPPIPDYLRDADRTSALSPLRSTPAHAIDRLSPNDRKVFEQTLHVAQQSGLPAEQAQNAAMALTATAKADPALQEVDRVVASNGRMFASYHPHGDREPTFHVSVDLNQAGNVPVEDSVQRIAQTRQQEPTAQQAIAQQMPAPDGPVRGPTRVL